MLNAQSRRELPGDLWVAELSRSFPDATIRLLAGLPVSDRAVELGDVVAESFDPIFEAGRAHPAIPDYELLYAGEGPGLDG